MSDHLSLKIIKILLILGIIASIITGIAIFFIEFEYMTFSLSSIMGGIMLFWVLPLIVLYSLVDSYLSSIDEGVQLSFWWTFWKGVGLSFIGGLIIGLIAFAMGDEWGGFLILLAPAFTSFFGAIASLVLTTIFYYLNKKKLGL